MPTGKKIKSFVDVMNRPVYREILELLQNEETPLSSKQIKEKLFPLQARSVNYSDPKGLIYTDVKFYPTINDQTLNTYLKRLHEFQLVKRIQIPNKRRVFYRALTIEEFLELNKNAPFPSIDEILEHVPAPQRAKYLENAIKSSDQLRKKGFNPPYSSRKVLESKTTDLKKNIEFLVKQFERDVAPIFETTEEEAINSIVVKYHSGETTVNMIYGNQKHITV
jgi:hypothetical protein